MAMSQSIAAFIERSLESRVTSGLFYARCLCPCFMYVNLVQKQADRELLAQTGRRFNHV